MKLPLAIAFLSACSVFAADYPRPELLVEPEALAKIRSDKKVVILDARAKTKYATSHIALARWVDHAEWAKSFGDGTDAAAWTKKIAALGIGAESQVIVYDDAQSKDAARIWWMLRYWGVPNVRLLNGGWIGWDKAKLPTDATVPEIAIAEFIAMAVPERLATKAGILKSLLKAGNLQIVDARSEGEHCGTDAMKNKKAGSIPGAKQLEWSDLLDKVSHRFKPAAELKTLFDEAGIRLDQPTAAHCQSGGRAAVMAFGLELMGAKSVSNYYKSWSEWGNSDDTPVAKPMPKKK